MESAAVDSGHRPRNKGSIDTMLPGGRTRLTDIGF